MHAVPLFINTMIKQTDDLTFDPRDAIQSFQMVTRETSGSDRVRVLMRFLGLQ